MLECFVIFLSWPIPVINGAIGERVNPGLNLVLMVLAEFLWMVSLAVSIVKLVN
jgi:hypothetical protein